MTAAETRGDNIRHNLQENVDSVPLRRMTTAASMAPSPSPSPTEERLTKKLPAQRIKHGIAEVKMVS